MRIYAPSYMRVDGLLTHLIWPDTIYCVHEFEADAYEAKGVNVLTIPDDLRGNIARVRNHVKGYAQAVDCPFLIIDDDIQTFAFWEGTERRSLTGDSAAEHLESMADLARSWGVTLFGVNPAADKGGYREYTPFATTSYCSGSFHGFTRQSDFTYDEALPLKEDYDFCLQVANKDRRLLRFNQYCLLKDDHGNTGGCADYRTVERERQQFDALQRKWGPAIVRRDSGKSKTRKKEQSYDINPIIRIPIAGV